MDEHGIDRRGFLAGGAGGLAALSGVTGTAGAEPRERPNVLWLVSEDNNPYIGAYGDPLARTPNLDALAREGVRFEHSFSEAPVCAPSRFAIITGMYAESCGPAHHMRAQGRLPDGVSAGFPALLREAGYYTTNNAKTDYNAPIDMAATWDESSNRAHWRNRPAGAPFFAIFNYMTTHESSMFTLTPGPTDPGAVRIPEYLPDTPTQRTDRAHYLNQVERMDAQVGAALAELEAAGLAEDTIVFYYSDNGGVLPRSKRFCFDSGLRTALIARFPRRWRHLAPGGAGSVYEAPVSGVDLGPTVLSLAGLDVPRRMHGVPFAGPRRRVRSREYAFGQRSRMDESYDLVRTVRDERFRYVRNYLPHLPYGQHVTYMFNQALLQGVGAALARRRSHRGPVAVLARQAGRGALRPRARPRRGPQPGRRPAPARTARAPAAGARPAHARDERQRPDPGGIGARGLRAEPRARRLPAAASDAAGRARRRARRGQPRPARRRARRRQRGDPVSGRPPGWRCSASAPRPPGASWSACSSATSRRRSRWPPPRRSPACS